LLSLLLAFAMAEAYDGDGDGEAADAAMEVSTGDPTAAAAAPSEAVGGWQDDAAAADAAVAAATAPAAVAATVEPSGDDGGGGEEAQWSQAGGDSNDWSSWSKGDQGNQGKKSWEPRRWKDDESWSDWRGEQKVQTPSGGGGWAAASQPWQPTKKVDDWAENGDANPELRAALAHKLIAPKWSNQNQEAPNTGGRWPQSQSWNNQTEAQDAGARPPLRQPWKAQKMGGFGAKTEAEEAPRSRSPRRSGGWGDEADGFGGSASGASWWGGKEEPSAEGGFQPRQPASTGISEAKRAQLAGLLRSTMHPMAANENPVAVPKAAVMATPFVAAPAPGRAPAPQADDPLVACLPPELQPQVRSVASSGSFEELVVACRALRESPWPELQLIGGAASGVAPGMHAPDTATLRALSERLLTRLEEQTLSQARAPPSGADHIQLFVHSNDLGPECSAVLRRLPEAAKLRVMRAGPVVGHDREAVFLARVRRAVDGLAKVGEDGELQSFIADNWIGTATERVLRGCPVEVQKKVMQKGPLLGPCPQKELILRLERLEAKAKKDTGLVV